MTKKDFFKKHEYVFDEQNNCYICPRDQVLNYSTTNRNGYKEYKSNSKICENCLYSVKCTESKNFTKVVTRHVWEDYMESIEDIRHTIGSKEIYKKRKETIERVFADAKENHRMRYTRYKGIDKVRNELSLIFSCMNLKKLAIWKDRLSYLLLYLIELSEKEINYIIKKQKTRESKINFNSLVYTLRGLRRVLFKFIY